MIGHHIGQEAETVAANGQAGDPASEQTPPAPGFQTLVIAPYDFFGTVGLAAHLAEVGRLSEAAALYRSLGPVADWAPTPHAALFAYTYGIVVATALDASDDVAGLRLKLDPYRGHHVVSGAGQVGYFGPVELWLGAAAAHLDLLDIAVADLEQAVKACAVSGAAGFRVEAQWRLAAVLARRARAGDPPRARSLAADASKQATLFGMVAIAATASGIVDQLDAAPSSEPLTPREREVAELVGQGLTNREIAERLYLSERTAQNHVQKILTKLQLPNRSQIAVWTTWQR